MITADWEERLEVLAPHLGAAFNARTFKQYTKFSRYDWVGCTEAGHWFTFTQSALEYEIRTRPPSLPCLIVNPIKGVSYLEAVTGSIPPEWPALLARGIFKMGEEDSLKVLEDYYGPLLSFHDKMACREELPRELWPLHWTTS